MVSEGAEVYVPHIWPLEVTNALVKAFRRQQITRQELFKYAERLARLRVTVDFEAAERAFEQVISLAERYRLTTSRSSLSLPYKRATHWTHHQRIFFVVPP
jgi:predicted nucleic acid-binding protein